MRDIKGDLLMCSWGDTQLSNQEEARLNSSERIGDAMLKWKNQYAIEALVWRQERWTAKFARLDSQGFKWRADQNKAIDEMDDAAAATKAAHELGIKIYCYVDMYDEGMPPHARNYTPGRYPWESKFFAEHPNYYACDRNWQNVHWGVPEYAYPEVREYKCRELAYLVDNYNWDGVYIATRGHRAPAEHGDQYGFNRPVAEAFMERYAVDILTENFDLEAWRRLRGEFVTEYLRDVRNMCEQRNLILGIGVPPGDYFGPPIGNLFIDWRTWVRENLIDGLVVGHANVVGKQPTGYGYLTSYYEGEFGLEPLPELIADDYVKICQENEVGLWVSLMIRERLANVYGKKYTNEILRSIHGVNGLFWSWANRGDHMLTVNLDDDPLPHSSFHEATMNNKEVSD